MGTVVLKKPKGDEMEDQVYEFRSSDTSLSNFGRSILCEDLVGVIDDWSAGLIVEMENVNLSTESLEASKIQGRLQALRYYKEFLLTLKDREIEGEENDS